MDSPLVEPFLSRAQTQAIPQEAGQVPRRMQRRLTDSVSEVNHRAVGVFSDGETPTHANAKSPILRRKKTRHQQPRAVYAALNGGAAAEMLFYPRSLKCSQGDCKSVLSTQESRYGTGICNECWDNTTKLCIVCKKTLLLKYVQWGTELCHECFNACDKECAMCRIALAVGSLHWGTGLCDACYDHREIDCKLCSKKLEKGQLRWGSGLCNECFDSCEKKCKICKNHIKVKQVRWNTGLCNSCWNDCQKQCTQCNINIPLGSMLWRTGLCDSCYDGRRKACSTSSETCKMCKSSLEDQAKHWGTGLCDKCYDKSHKMCKICRKQIPLGQLHWGSGVCDTCYNECDKKCRMCEGVILLGQLRWGTGICDACFDGCEKTCRDCECRIDVGQVKWGTGYCDKCWDAHQKKGKDVITSGVKAVIGAQLAFYLAPALLQPSLFLQISEKGYLPNPSTVYAAVLTTAGIVAMLLPYPLGVWAEYQGERQVYVGVSVLAVLSSAILLTSPPAPVLAIAWAVLNGPPNIRGVRAAYFAKHVPPEDLSWAGQMASSVGLIGGFLGPFGSMLVERVFGDGSDGAWWDGFTGSALFAVATGMVCAFALAVCLPGKTRNKNSEKRKDVYHVEKCERCSKELNAKERDFATALCDTCWDNYAGAGYGFKTFRWHLLLSWCIIASLLEFSMNAGILATFQPVVVNHFNWGSTTIAQVTVVGTGLSVVISLTMTRFRLQPQWQTLAASLLYLLGVVIFTAQPLRQWRVILGYLFGIKAQILFMSPFIAIFSTLIGSVRVTNRLTTALCLAPPCGAALGTSAAPLFVTWSDSPLFMLVSVPALMAVTLIVCKWDLMEGDMEVYSKKSSDAKKWRWDRQHSKDSEETGEVEVSREQEQP